ncbi:MAG: nucleotidyltransferase family protein [Gemmatimonadota bacterium]
MGYRTSGPGGVTPLARFLLRLLGPHPHGLEGVTWQTALPVLEARGLGSLAVAVDAELGGILPPHIREALLPAYRLGGLRTTLLMEMAQRTVGELARVGVPSLLVKGAALLAQGQYPTPAARPMSDVDLLIPPECAEVAVATLAAAGYIPWSPWEPARKDWLDSVTLHAPGSSSHLPLVLDLHWRLSFSNLRFGPGQVDPPLLHVQREVGSEGGTRLIEGGLALEALPVPPAAPHLVLLLEHVLKHLRYRTHLPGLADAARVAHLVESWEAVVELAGRRHWSGGIGLLLELLSREAQVVVPSWVLAGLTPSGIWLGPARRSLHANSMTLRERPVEGRVSGLLLRGSLVGSPFRALTDLHRVVWPSVAWLRARYPAAVGRRAGRRLRYLLDVGRWIWGRGASPLSPNQDGGESPPGVTPPDSGRRDVAQGRSSR